VNRLQKFFRAVFSGYVFLIVNAVYSLASVPLILAYLDKAEFGLWALTAQITGYLALLDVGQGGATTRILIDYKDEPAKGRYGAVIKSAVLVGVLQGIGVLLVAGLLCLTAGSFFKIPPALGREFAWLLLGQAMVLAGSCCTRVSSQLLVAHQRQDITNSIQSLALVVNIAILVTAFRGHLGYLSLPLAQLGSQVFSAICQLWAALSLRLFPRRGEWGALSKQRFAELFAFGRDVSLYTLGLQLVGASQTIVISRHLGLEMVGVWSVCTRVFTLISQAVYRLFDFSYPMLSEMLVRKETGQLKQRFKDIAGISMGLGAVAGVLLVLCNGVFVALWTRGRFGWSLSCDLWLALLILIGVFVRLHIGLIGVTKCFRFLRYLFLCEGCLFILVCQFTVPGYGIQGVLIASALSSLVFSVPYGLSRTVELFAVSPGEVLFRWNAPALKMLCCLVPVALLAGWAGRAWGASWTLLLYGGGVGLLALPLFWTTVLSGATKQDLQQYLKRT
jgi:O-antigen/teichoic acid export membrane protein